MWTGHRFLWLYLFHYSYNSLGLLAQLGVADWKWLGVFPLQTDCLMYFIPGYLSVGTQYNVICGRQGNGLDLLVTSWPVSQNVSNSWASEAFGILVPHSFHREKIQCYIFFIAHTEYHNNWVLFCPETICNLRSTLGHPYLAQWWNVGYNWASLYITASSH